MALHRHRRPDPHRIAPNGQNASLQLPTLASSVVQTSYAAYLSHLCLGLARGHRCRDNHHLFYGVDPDWDMTTKARSITWPPWSPDAKRKEAMPPPDSKQATWTVNNRRLRLIGSDEGRRNGWSDAQVGLRGSPAYQRRPFKQLGRRRAPEQSSPRSLLVFALAVTDETLEPCRICQLVMKRDEVVVVNRWTADITLKLIR